MSPRDKRRLAIVFVSLFTITIFYLALCYVPSYLYVAFILGVSGVVCCYNTRELPFLARTGLNPRPGLTVPPALRRWLPGRTVTGAAPVAKAGHRVRPGEVDGRASAVSPVESPAYRRDAAFADFFSPRDLLMGSYIGKPESPSAPARVAGGSGHCPNPREQLRERLSRPNHAVHTPNRRLSFGEPLGTVSRFAITPQRHYPLQQPGTTAALGILPPAQWEGFRKKNVFSPRNSSTVHSPVTVKIARPDSHASQAVLFNHLNSPSTTVSPDPCSRESVLSILRENRKREVEEEDERCHAEGQKSKRRRHDSGGSSHSAFEPLLANGLPSLLVPKPGSLKRGLNVSVAEESMMKRSRTSSISSVSGGSRAAGVLGSDRNPIRSSYSSSHGYKQRKSSSNFSISPLTSPGSSRSQTPERAAKKAREEAASSPSSPPYKRADKTASEIPAVTGKHTPVPETPVSVETSESGGSGGKRKRKIQLLSNRRGENITLPPPPELGYTITVDDLDKEKKAALSQIQKVLQEPEPEEPPPTPQPVLAVATSAPSSASAVLVSVPSVASESSTGAPAPSLLSSVITYTAPISTTSSTATSVLSTAVLAAPASTALGTQVTSTIPTATSTSIVPNPLLESLKTMKSPLFPTASLSTSTTLTSVPIASAAEPSSATVKAELSALVPQTTTSTASITRPAPPLNSAFAQVLAQPLQPASNGISLSGSSLFGIVNSKITSSTTFGSLPSSGFKPIFGAPAPAAPPAQSTVQESKPAVPTFTPVFGSTSSVFGQQPVPAATSAPARTVTVGSLFGGLANSQPAPTSSTTTTTAAASTITPAKNLFGGWSTATTSAPPINSTFQFGAASAINTTSAASVSNTNSTSTTNTFQFGATKPPAAPQTVPLPAPQGTFVFGQTSGGQSATAAPFGGFPMGSTNAPAPATTTAPTSVFGNPSSNFSNAPQASATKPFTFGASGGVGGAASPFAFGGAGHGATSTAAPSFGTVSQPAFGGTTSNFSFGGATSTPSVAPAFGAPSTQAAPSLPAPVPTFAFGALSGATQNPAQNTAGQPTTGGFNFGTAAQFGTPAQTPSFQFGANATSDNKPTFGTSTPSFGQGSTGGSIPFGSPGTPIQGFGGLSSAQFGTPPASFSIGAGSKPSGARQRLQARRQHVRKK
uniref:POM121 transmembrane nucleoporin n=1 Tax=Denticeps clupeoides TaxID=299321 RepID=A0AAY4EJT9_9TELE